MLDRSFGLKAVGLVALVLLFGWVSSAEARQFQMSGKWVQRRGVVAIPVAPGSNGVPGAAIVNATGTGAATFTVPPGAFTGSFTALFPLPQPSIVQLSSHFISMYGPKSSGVMKPAFWVGNRPNMNFAYCPGAVANPACVDWRSTGTGATANQGSYHGLVRYTAGPQQFGGTMNMVSGGGGVLSLRIGTNTVMHNAFGAAVGAYGAAPTEAPGGPYANTLYPDNLPPGIITINAGISGGGLITVPGTPVGLGATSYIINRGFSWTTGQVYVKGTNAGPVTSTTVSITGSDARTPLGAGNITLVAGGFGNRVSLGFDYMSFDRIEMTMKFPVNPLPSMSPAGVAAGAVLMVLAVGYALRRRF